jgi:pimeloyl-ACP methyl ester carboxylesterase
LWVIWVIVLLGLAPWRGGAAAQAPLAQPQAAISGQITVNVNGTVMPEPRVTVELRDATGEAVLASTVTDANGRYQFTGRTGIFYVIPRKSVFEFTPVRDRVIVGVVSGRDFGDDTANFTMKLPPIILVGDFSPTSLPQSSCPQRRLDGSTYQPGICPSHPRIAPLIANLTAAGYRVYPVMLESSVFGTPRLSRQTSVLRRVIGVAKADTGASKVIVFGHGMGGLAARRYIEDNAIYQGDVSHLFTFGTPHLGNSIENAWFHYLAVVLPRNLSSNIFIPADVIPMLVSLIAVDASGALNFLCSTSTGTFTIPFVGTYTIPGPGQALLCETSNSGMANFNLAFRPRAGVSYHLIHGGIDPANLFSGLAHDISRAIPGGDDGIFQTRSARDFGGGLHDRLLTSEPHGILTDHTTYWYWAPGFTDGTYRDCLEPMFVTRRLTAPVCGTPSVQNSEIASFHREAAQSQTAPLAMTDAVLIEQKTALRTALLPDTTTIVTQPVSLVEATRATFLSSWISGTVELTLVDPNGTVITPTLTSLPPGVATYNADETHASYAFTTTRTGLYTMRLRATETLTTGLPVSYFAGLDSAYMLTTARSRNWLPPGAQITVTAVFTGPTAIANPLVTAHVLRSDGVSETLTLNPTATDTFAVVYTAPNAPGYITMDILAASDTPQGAIERAESLGFTGERPCERQAAAPARSGPAGCHLPPARRSAAAARVPDFPWPSPTRWRRADNVRRDA